ncbi:MAG: hypothetical protein JXR39_02435 [Marinilabiliaceae bacterium]|nr:hypothetical protein [Marinilabiliaceae bacterium]
MLDQKRLNNATCVEMGNTAHGIPYHVLYPTVGSVKATKDERTDRQRLFNQLEGWFFNNTGWALAQKLERAFDALDKEAPSLVNQTAKEFIALVLADGLRRYNQNTILERAEIGGYVSREGGEL